MSSDTYLSDEVDIRSTPVLTEQDLVVIRDVDRALADGRRLKLWWEQKDATGTYAQKFDLVRTFNQPDRGMGFFDTAPLDGRDLNVMGIVQEMLFDQPKQAPAEKVRDEFREFILRYFMRVSSFRQPEAYAEPSQQKRQNIRRSLQPFSFCTDDEDTRIGFGYSQLYYKLRDSGQVGKFSRRDEFTIVDLREIGDKYEWIVCKVRIFNFNIAFKPFGPESFSLVFPLREETYIALSRDFITCRDNPSPLVLGEYGFGYALLKPAPQRSIFAYGPGYFSAGFQLINFEIRKGGQSHARMAFVSNRPERVLNIEIDPLGWGFRLADLMSFGMASRLFGPVKDVLQRYSPRINNFDPVTTYISLANILTGGQAEEDLCLSLETLEKNPMLLTHFMEHYQMVLSSLMTWRYVQSWLDTASLPQPVIRGVSS